ncbi:MAG: hypothetical protein Q9173_005830 [Seirophora scorigena]
MSFGFSLGDIRLAWQLGSFLHEKCFTRAQGAGRFPSLVPRLVDLQPQPLKLVATVLTLSSNNVDILYRRFGREIELFTESLQKLEAVIDHANRQRPRRPFRNHNDNCRQALQPLSQLVGDFKTTLDECEQLLNDHERFKRDPAGFVDNVVWHVSTQRDVDILSERVHFHATKLLVVSKPFETHLLLEICRELQDLRRDVSEIKGLLVDVLTNGESTLSQLSAAQRVTFPDIPNEIVARFIMAIHSDPPATYQDISNVPLKEGFDALVYHFSQSTVKMNPTFDPSQRTPEETQFLNLLKSKWILEKLEASSSLAAADTAPLWASALAEVKFEIINEYKRFNTEQLVAPPMDVIARLPDECFYIWVVEAPPILPPDLAEQRPLEDQILEIALPDSIGTRRSSLHVFRRSPVELRLVTTTRDTANPGYHQEKGKYYFIVNTDATRVIPAYATPEGGTNRHNLLLSNRHVQDLRWQYLANADGVADVARLQQALTGYRVHYTMSAASLQLPRTILIISDSTNVSWSINGSDKPHKLGKAMVQLWQLQTLQSPASSSNTTPVPSDYSAMSPRSGLVSRTSSVATNTGLSARSTAGTGSTTLFSGSSATSVMVGSRHNGTAVLAPDPPVMVFYTVHNEKYTFLHLELTNSTFINPERCNCRRNSKKECLTAVLETKGEVIDLRRSCASEASGRGLYTWDLAKFRMPRHPQYKDVQVLEKVKYLTLRFESVEAKDEFRKELRLLEKVRDLEMDMCRDILREKQNRDRKPAKR